MARPPKLSSLDTLIQRFAESIAERVVAQRGVAGPKASAKGATRRKSRDMRCRYPGCKNRSKGPRFRFLCDEHLKLPKKKQQAALEKWAVTMPKAQTAGIEEAIALAVEKHRGQKARGRALFQFHGTGVGACRGSDILGAAGTIENAVGISVFPSARRPASAYFF
jgi:hypothetical protein